VAEAAKRDNQAAIGAAAGPFDVGYDDLVDHDHYLKAELYQRVREDPAIFDFLQDGSLDGIWYWDLDNPEQEWLSPRFKEVFGYTDDEVPNTPEWWQANIFPEDGDRALENFRRHCADPKHPYDQIVRYRHKDGSTVWVRCRGLAIRDDTGRPRRMLGAHTDVTGIKQAEERLRAIHEASPDMHVTLELREGKVTDCNQNFVDVLRRPRAEILDASFLDLCPSARRDAAAAALAALRAHGAVTDVELVLERADGAPVAVVFTAVARPGEDRAAAVAQAWCRDVTHLRRQANVQVLIESLPNPAVLLDEAGSLTVANPAAARMFGYRREELRGRDLALLLPDSDPAGPASGEFTGRRSDGSGFPAEVSVGPIATREGTLSLVEILDITERKSAEMAVRDSEQQFRQLTDSLPQLVWTSGPDGQCDFLSRRWVEYTGVPADVQLGSGWLDQVHPDDRPGLTAEWTHALGAGAEFHAEFRIRRHDGAYGWFDTRAVPLLDGEGCVKKWFGTNTDVTERKRTEDEIRRSRAQLAEALEAGEMGTWLFDARRNDILLDEAGRKLLGVTGEMAAGGETEVDFSRIHLDDWPHLTPLAEAIARGEDLGPIARECRVVMPDAAVRWFAVRGRQDGESVGARGTWSTGIVQDVTTRKTADELTLRSQKLEALGTLAGGIAHDFNNILTAISGNTQLALRGTDRAHPARQFLDEIEKAAMRAAELARRILTFGRPQDADREVCPLAPIVDEALRLLRATLPAMIEIHADVRADLPPVAVSATQLHQVIMNLGTNAAQAMADAGGVLEVRAERVTPDREFAEQMKLRRQPHVRLSVRDDGCGIPAEVIDRIFDPFFTTKAPGEGTGLGLSMVHGIMRAHGGAVVVESPLGAGTVFELYFPVADAEPDAADAGPDAADAAPEIAPPPDRRSVLFVDDEESILRMARDMLEHMGYRVTAVAHPKRALEIFRTAPGDFDVVVSDLTMPGMSGLALAAGLRATHRYKPIVLCSGLLSEETLAAAADLGIQAVVSKPYIITDIARAIEEVVQ
jgi:PAS domain S-box-containing protein